MLTSILLVSMNQWCNALQAFVGIFKHLCNAPHKFMKVLTHMSVAISPNAVTYATEKLSKNAIQAIERAGRRTNLQL